MGDNSNLLIIGFLIAIGLAISFIVKLAAEVKHLRAEEAVRQAAIRRAEEAARLERHKAEEANRRAEEGARLEHHKEEASRKAEKNEMKTPNELFEELFKESERKTKIQQAEHLKKLAGTKVRLVADIRDIHYDYITLQNITPALSGSSIHVSYKDDQLRTQLLECSLGDRVEITTQLTHAIFGSHPTCFLDLLSIRKLNK